MTKFTVTVRATRQIIGTFSTINEAEWFAYHNVYVPEQLEIGRAL